MGFPADLFKQSATLWVYSSTDSFGDPSYAAPKRLSPSNGNGIRWENRTEKFLRSTGEEDLSRAIVWSSTTAFTVGSYLYLGSSTATNPETVTGAAQILHVDSVPDVKGLNTIYRAVL